MQTSRKAKEQFFRTNLVATATAAEVLRRHLASYKRVNAAAVEMLLWQPLDRAAVFVLNSTDKTDEVQLELVRRAILKMQSVICDTLNWSINSSTALYDRMALTTLPDRLAVCAREVFEALPDSESDERFSAKPKQRSVPAKLWENVSVLRLFARTVDVEKTLTDLNLGAFVSSARGLSTQEERNYAAKLWAKCFPPEPASSRSNTEGGPIPSNIAVVQLPSGYLEVTAVIDPKRALTLSGAEMCDLPTALSEKLKVQREVIHCSYVNLQAAVQRCEAWLESHRAASATLQAEYDACVEQRASNNLMEKLKEQLSEEELALLRREIRREMGREQAASA